jgi:hypothetical protein
MSSAKMGAIDSFLENCPKITFPPLHLTKLRIGFFRELDNESLHRLVVVVCDLCCEPVGDTEHQ